MIFFSPKQSLTLKFTGILVSLAFFSGQSLFAQSIQSIEATREAIRIDGKPNEAAWSNASVQLLQQWPLTPPGHTPGSNDLEAFWKGLWDREHLYLYIQVHDDIIITDSRHENLAREDDSVEIFINPHAAQSVAIGEAPPSSPHSGDLPEDFFHLLARPNLGFTFTRISQVNASQLPAEVASIIRIPKGYSIELAIPWTALGLRGVSASFAFTLDIQVNDDDNGGAREAQLTWSDPYGEAWFNPALLGWAELVGNPDRIQEGALVQHTLWPAFYASEDYYLIESTDIDFDQTVLLQSPWFGWFYVMDFSGWIYHAEHRWLFLHKVNENNIFFYEPGRGWFWTGMRTYPFILERNRESIRWLYYQEGSGYTGKRWFKVVQPEGSWFSPEG